jgi:cobalt-zinc-cadmium efflux system outer membrane protein
MDTEERRAPVRRRPWLVGLLLLVPACSITESRNIDQQLRDLTGRVEQVDPCRVMDQLPPSDDPRDEPGGSPEGGQAVGFLPAVPDDAFRPVASQPDKPEQPKVRKLTVPSGLPGADAPPIVLPDDPQERQRYVKRLFPPLEALLPIRAIAPGPEGRPLTLADLQRLGALYSPAIKNAIAAVKAAEGAARQAGAYPNPSFLYEHDTAETGPAGYPGFGIDQVIKTGNKLKLQEAAAVMDLLNARLALRRAYSDLAYQIRGNYFTVLVALENIRISEVLYKFTTEIYEVQVDYLDKGLGAGYEPMQLRPLALAARLNLIQARNQYLAAWKQLAANMGLRDMPPSEVAGRVDLPVPVFDHDQVRARVLANHTDVLTAYNALQKAQYNLQLARVTPLPDVELRILAQKDYTTPPNQIAHSVTVSVPVPIWDQNKGGIRQAEGMLEQAAVGPDQARNSLTVTLADAFNRYETAVQSVQITLQQVRDQLLVYRRLRARWEDASVGFGDLVTAQQTLVTYITAYVAALGLQWQAVVDVANLLQTDDLFQVGPPHDVDPVPDLDHLRLPACPPRPRVLPGVKAQPEPDGLQRLPDIPADAQRAPSGANILPAVAPAPPAASVPASRMYGAPEVLPRRSPSDGARRVNQEGL